MLLQHATIHKSNHTMFFRSVFSCRFDHFRAHSQYKIKGGGNWKYVQTCKMERLASCFHSEVNKYIKKVLKIGKRLFQEMGKRLHRCEYITSSVLTLNIRDNVPRDRKPADLIEFLVRVGCLFLVWCLFQLGQRWVGGFAMRSILCFVLFTYFR